MHARRGAIPAALVVALSLVVGSPLVAPATAAVGVLTCGASVTEDVVLTHDLECTGGAPIEVAAGVTIDLAGHTITWNDAVRPCDSSFAIPCAISFAEGGTLRGGTLRGAGVSGAEGLVVERVAVDDGSVVLLGVRTAPSPNVLVRSTVRGGTVLLIGARNEVRSNIVRDGTILLHHQPRAMPDTFVEGNLVLGAVDSGIRLRTYFYPPPDVTGRIGGNVVMRSARHGIEIEGAVQNIDALEVSGNLLVRNGGSGLDVHGQGPPVPSDAQVTISRNLAVGNAGHGIDAQWVPGLPTGIVDGGGNVASANRTSPQCLGVVCRGMGRSSG